MEFMQVPSWPKQSRSLPYLNMVMDDQNAIKKAFNARAVMVRQGKGIIAQKSP